MNALRKEESEVIAEFEVAIKQLRAAYVSAINNFTRLAMNPDLKNNSPQKELDELEMAQKRFDEARGNMDRITTQFQKGLRS